MIIAISSEHLHNRSKDQVDSAAARPPGSPHTPPHNASDLLSFTNSLAFLISVVCGYICVCISLAALRPPTMPRTSCHLLLFSFLVIVVQRPPSPILWQCVPCILHLSFDLCFVFVFLSAEVYLMFLASNPFVLTSGFTICRWSILVRACQSRPLSHPSCDQAHQLLNSDPH